MEKTFKIAAVLLALFSAAIVANADDLPSTTTLAGGTPVGLVLRTPLKSGATRVGTIVKFTLVAPIYTKDHAIIAPIGSSAFGVVTQSTKHKLLGRAGSLQFTCDYVIAPDGTRIPLTGTGMYSSGMNETSAVVVATVLFNPLGLLIEGSDTSIQPGTPVDMWTARATDVKIVDRTSDAPQAPVTTFVLKDKNTLSIVGTVSSFDGLAYDVNTFNGDQKISVQDIKAIFGTAS